MASNVICLEGKLPSSRSPRYIPPFVVVNHPFRHISAKPIILNSKIGYTKDLLHNFFFGGGGI